MSAVEPRPAPGDEPAPDGPHHLYDQVAEASAALVIEHYSSSFGLASRLLAEPVRTRVRNVYALVRVADEVVDAPRPDATRAQQAHVLDELEAEVRVALVRGHSSNLVVHAFARTARRCGIGHDLIDPFFASMRTDLFRTVHDQDSFERYVYGSAEVIGLMCLRAFLADEPGPEAAYDALAGGAQRLGAAFQKVNFLRDLATDEGLLGRSYFPGVDPARLDDATRDRLLDGIDADLAAAAAVIPALPASSRRAVRVAHGLFAELSTRLRRTPAAEIRQRRVRVPGPAKARIAARCLLRGGR
ncbi:squalene/phytoene synthase family protein [Nocardioides sp. zg-DK7169]|uniref:phytoene/squalene synthase family protein n=1 Tax=Nocardioides sp. zg-DK7169 TaxID=2736600 RepID=UPI0015559BC2|nr:squalene/phytoene synthase family protein [Nocardioides sp. zg-DK7169]NPC97916.1 squalene/phytoene synthase family protein [Nocardioides sp. zg-DK7169]